MLVLTRTKGETIEIRVDGKLVVLTVLRVKGNYIRLGCTAPREVHIKRGELNKRTGAA